MKEKRVLLKGLIIYLLIPISCGIEKQLAPPFENAPVIIKTTEKMIANNEAHPKSYIVTFRSSYTGSRLHYSSFQSEFKHNYQALAQLSLGEADITDIHFISTVDLSEPEAITAALELSVPKSLQLAWSSKRFSHATGAMAQVDFTSQMKAQQILDRWQKQGRIWFAEPNYISRPSGYWQDQREAYENLDIAWHQAINLYEAYTHLDSLAGSTSERPIVAIMDSGIDAEHPLLKDNMWTNEDLGSGDCGGDDFYGCNTTNPEKGQLGTGAIYPFGTSDFGQVCPDQPSSPGRCARDCCHGTHVAGIVAAKSNDAAVAGACPICRIMALRIMGTSEAAGTGDQGVILDSSILRALKYVAGFRKTGPDDTDIRIVNASFGKFQRSRAVSILVRALKDNGRGVMVIAAAGNEDTNKRQFPAALEEAIGVANVDQDGNKASSSNFGLWVDVSAPGMGIVSAIPGPASESKTEDKGGTSMAAPVVSAIAALVIASNQSISFAGLRSRIVETADPSLYNKEINTHYIPRIPGETLPIPLLGKGLVQANNAVSGAKQDVPAVGALDRVGEGCAVIGLAPSKYQFWVVLLLATPLIWILRRARI